MAPPVGQIRPLRYLAFFAFILVVVYTLVLLPVFLGHDKPTPKLGIELQGGTRVTLTAKTLNGGVPDKDSLNQARQIIEKRVNGIGVEGAEVVLDGNNLVITVSGADGDQAKTLGKTARLGFRPVVMAPQELQQLASAVNGLKATDTSKPVTDIKTALASLQNPTTNVGSSAKLLQEVFAKDVDQTGALSTDKLQQDPNLATALATLSCVPNALQAPPATGPAAQRNSGRADELLAGSDDPKLPLVACGKDGGPYVLGPVFLDGTSISGASSGVNPDTVGQWEVQLSFTSQGSKIWGDYTSAHNEATAPGGKNAAAFVLDGLVQSAPTIQNPIVGGTTRITGQFTQPEAQDLTNVLKYGSLPLSFDSSTATTVSATLGLASLRAGLIAGAIGLALVFVYCLFYYRVLGVLTILSLAMSGAIVYGILVLLGRWIGFTLDLAGIAGFIIAIGVTADSFVIFFERLKDEIREGRTFRSAVPRGWIRARRTILTADAVMFLAAATLYILAVGEVQGFAFTLGMSTVLDLVVVFLVTHPLVALAAKSKTLSSPKMSGLGRVQRVAGTSKPAASNAARATAGKDL